MKEGNLMKKRITAIICLFILLSQQVSASVLGTEILGWDHDIANGTKIYKNTFMSDQEGVGGQVEYYAEYTPNENVVPTIISGDELWGFDTISEAEKYMKENNMVPLIGINASFFSLKTGLPMGHVISNGKILSKDTETYQSIGFLPDGRGFIAPLSIKTTLYYGENQVDIAHINKYNQEFMDIINLYTPEFADHNHNDFPSLTLILGQLEGELGVGKEVTAIVEEKFNYTGPLLLPDDKIMLTINENARPDLYAALSSINIGDEVKLLSEAYGHEKWELVDSALGSVGDTLISNGIIQSDFEAGSAPRTAVGITNDGRIIFYVLDGRQKPYSYGAQLKTLAKRMEELGCIDAINLDGGGSSVISGVFPGSSQSTVFNSPSDGKPRGVSNYIFLKNAQTPTGNVGNLYVYPFKQHYLSGYSEQLHTVAVDSSYYPTNIPQDISFQVDGTNSFVDENGILNALGEGEFDVYVTSGNITGKASYTSYETPTNINVYNKDTNEEITTIFAKQGDIIKLSFSAQHNYIDLKSSIECFDLNITNNMGYMDENQLVITADGGQGELLVSAGEYTKKIPITVKRDNPFYDTDSHWAKESIKKVYQAGIVNGVIQNGKPMFMPNENITREEFAVILCKCFDQHINQYNSEYDLSMFSDANEISDWAKPYVAATFEMGLLNGKLDGNDVKFAPKDYFTRAEVMTALGRIIENKFEDEKYDDLKFVDFGDIPEWAMKYVKIMVNNGFVSGYNDNTVRPQNNISRAEVATVIANMFID